MEHEKSRESVSNRAFRVGFGEFSGTVSQPQKILELDGLNEVVVYDQTFHDSPVERATLRTEKIVINGAELLEIGAEIVLSKEMEDIEDFEKDFINLLTEPNDVLLAHGLKIEKSLLDDTARVSDEEGPAFLINVSVIGAKPVIYIGNNMSEFDEENKTSEQVNPLLADYALNKIEFQKFLKTFMHIMDYTVEISERYELEFNPEFPPKHYDFRPIKIPEQIDSGEKTAKNVGGVALEKRPEAPVYLMEDQKGQIFEPTVNLSEVGGIFEQMEEIESIIAGFENPEIMRQWGVEPAQAILMYGPPGTGKTMLSEAIAKESGAKITSIDSSHIYNMYVGNSAKNMKEFFDKVKNYSAGKLVVAMDEIDTILSSGGTSEHKNVAGIFKQEMNNLNNPNVLIIGITNFEENLDPAFVRSGRFNNKIYLKLPDASERHSIATKVMSAHISEGSNPFALEGLGIDLQKIGELTKGLNGADIAEIYKRTLRKKGIDQHKTGEDPGKITTEDIIDQIDGLNRQ